MFAILQNLWTDEQGQGLTEYAIIIAFVAVFVIAAIIAFRVQIEGILTSAGAAITAY